MRILHLSDCHLHDSKTEIKAGYNTYKSLQSVINLALESKQEFDIAIISGDICQTPSAASYALFEQLISQLEIPFLAVPGNHDNPALLKTVAPHCPDELATSTIIKNTYFLLINSQVINQEYGEVCENDLQHIETLLEQHRTLVTVVIIHHPPVLTGSLWMDKIGLRNKSTFIETLTRFSNVKTVLLGHVHQEIDQQYAQLRILGTPSTCYQFKPNSESVDYDTKRPGFRYIHLDASGEVKTSVKRIDHV